MTFLFLLLLCFNSIESIFLRLFRLLNLKLVNHMNVFDSGLKAFFFFHVFRALTAIITFKADKFVVTTAACTQAFAAHRDLFTFIWGIGPWSTSNIGFQVDFVHLLQIWKAHRRDVFLKDFQLTVFTWLGQIKHINCCSITFAAILILDSRHWWDSLILLLVHFIERALRKHLNWPLLTGIFALVQTALIHIIFFPNWR